MVHALADQRYGRLAAKKRQDSTIDELEEFALSLPEAWVDSPWGDRVVKVAKKIFVFLSSRTPSGPGSRSSCPIRTTTR